MSPVKNRATGNPIPVEVSTRPTTERIQTATLTSGYDARAFSNIFYPTVALARCESSPFTPYSVFSRNKAGPPDELYAMHPVL